jgi:hypothetical protein
MLKLRNAAKTVNRTESVMIKVASCRSLGLTSADRETDFHDELESPKGRPYPTKVPSEDSSPEA